MLNITKLSYFDELGQLDLPKDDFAIYGSCSLVVEGLKENNSDIDIIVRKNLWDKLSKKHLVQKGIGIGNTYREYITINHIEIDCSLGDFTDDVESIIDRATIVDGYRVMNLEDSIKLKLYMGRDKDIIDLKKIEELKKK